MTTVMGRHAAMLQPSLLLVALPIAEKPAVHAAVKEVVETDEAVLVPEGICPDRDPAGAVRTLDALAVLVARGWPWQNAAPTLRRHLTDEAYRRLERRLAPRRFGR